MRKARSLGAARPAPVKAPRLDLHMHSDRSDGHYPPEEVLARCAAGGLDVIALTDHDLLPVLPAGPVDVDGHTVRVLASAEVSGTHEGREYHLLVYFPGPVPPAYADWLVQRASSRARRYDAALDALGADDIPRAPPEAHAGRVALTRHHLARALLLSGRASTFSEAMRLLTEGSRVPLIDVSYVDAIRAARAAGGFCSWAHPALGDAQRHVATFAAAGLQALEGHRPRLDRPTRNGLKRLAQKHRLLMTGGTDWHGWSDAPLGLFSLADEHAVAFLRALDAPAA